MRQHITLLFSTLLVLFLAEGPKSTRGIEFEYYYSDTCDPECPLIACSDWGSDDCFQGISWGGPVDTDDLPDCSCDCSTLGSGPDKDIVVNNGTCFGTDCFILCEDNNVPYVFYVINISSADVTLRLETTGGCRYGQGGDSDECAYIVSSNNLDGDGDNGATPLVDWMGLI
jgi:hypothetical protein